MLKLVRLALTAAILTAIAVRLRRRARMPARQPAPPAPGPRPARSMRMVAAWVLIAVLVALTLVAALVPAHERAAGADRQAGELRPEALAAVEHGAPPAAPSPVPSLVTSPVTSPVPTPEPTPAPSEIPDPSCSPAPRPVTVRPIDPRVKRAVDRQWRRVERWLKANAPRTYRTLGGPGKARTIAVAESQMGVDFPDDLRASLLRHNGASGKRAFGFGSWPDGAVNLSTRRIRDSWRALCSWGRTDRGPDPTVEYWNGRMIPFLYYPGRSADVMAYAVVDSVGGAVGWDDSSSGMAPRMPSYYALMRAVADALEHGTPVEGRRPVVERGVLRWERS
ncbi:MULTISPECIES: SMI1/KNR4 family protein [unclassified Nonomuraea]|uniref:SMI1/KNR4 family protein n=1 Tax=unclassified Nonomuraea TaxID=2593643 RepID=UPI0035C1D2E7